MTAGVVHLAETGCLVGRTRCFTSSMCSCIGTWVLGFLAVTLQPTGWQNWNFTKLCRILSTY